MANSDISGQITDSSGNGVGNAEVYLWREDLAGAGGVVASTTADSSGNFAFTAHPDGTSNSESWHVAAEDPNADVQLQSAYGVTASPPTSVDSQFNVSITDTSPSPVRRGNTLTVDASLNNSGTDSDTQTITLDINSGVGKVDSSLDAAQAGASETTTLEWAVASDQTVQDYQVTVGSDDDTATQTVTVAIPDSRVARWTLDASDTNSGPTAVDVWNSNDASGEGTIATGITGANQTYNSGEAWSLEPGRIQTPITQSYFAGQTAVSIAGWIRTTDTEIALLSSNQRNDGIVFLLAEDGNGKAQFKLRGVENASTGDISDATWHHIVGTYDGSTVALYVDGSQSDATSASGGISDQDSGTDLNAYLGSARFTEDGSKNSDIDDVRLYSKGLTSTEVSNLYQTGSING